LSAPELRFIDLDNILTDFDIWKGLTHLGLDNTFSIAGLSAKELLGLLERSPSLQELKLYDIGAHVPEGPEVRQAVELRHLSILHLKFLSPALATYLLRCLYIPSSAPLVIMCPLHPSHLGIEFDEGRISINRNPDHTSLDIDEEFWEDMISMISILFASVNMSLIRGLTATYYNSVYWGGPPLSPGHWIPTFKALPSLTNLTLELTAYWMRSALQALHPSEPSGLVLCPALNQLHLRVSAAGFDPAGPPLDGVVVDYLKARSSSGRPPLETLEMNFVEDSSVEELESLVSNLIRRVRMPFCSSYLPV
jgi:hypothetical protein